MSHVVEIQIELRDLNAIRAAVKRLGGIWHENQQAYAWWGRSVGDYPLPEGVRKEDLGKCDHAFGFPGADYEVGVIRKPNGQYRLQWDFYDTGGLMPFMGNEQGHKFAQAYGIEKAKIEAKKNGYLASEKTLADGSIQLTMSKLGG